MDLGRARSNSNNGPDRKQFEKEYNYYSCFDFFPDDFIIKNKISLLTAEDRIVYDETYYAYRGCIEQFLSSYKNDLTPNSTLTQLLQEIKEKEHLITRFKKRYGLL